MSNIRGGGGSSSYAPVHSYDYYLVYYIWALQYCSDFGSMKKLSSKLQ